MTRSQRLAFLGIAVVIAVVAVVVLAGSGGSGKQPSSGAATAGSAEPVLHAGKVAKIKVGQGDTVRFEATNDAPEEIHVHGYDLKQDVSKGKPARFSFKATITGIFVIELERSGTQIGELTVEPR